MKIQNKNILIRQQDLSDCGAACLSSVLAYFGRIKPVSRIRLEAGTNRNGTSLLGLVEVAKKENLIASPVQINDKKINHSDLPAIAHLKIKNSWFHYVVIYKKTNEGFLIMDPADGKINQVAFKDFLNEWTGVLLILSPGENFTKSNSYSTPVQRIIRILNEHKSSLLKSVAGAFLYSLLGIATARYVELLSDDIIPGDQSDNLNLLSISMIGIVILRVITGYIKNILILKTGRKIDFDLINNYNKHILSLPVSFFHSMKTGEVLTRINDAIKIRSFINSIAQDLAVNVIIVLVTLIIMFHYSSIISAVLLMSMPVFYFIYKFLDQTNRKYLRKNMELSAELESQLVESIKGVKIIKAFTKEGYFYRKMENISTRLLSSIYRASRDFTLSSHFSELTSSIWLILILWLGSWQVIHDKLSYGELFSFYALYAYISSPLIRLILSNRGIQDAKIAAERLFQVMDLEKESEIVKKDEIGNDNESACIKVDKINFSFPGNLTLLKDISFQCMPGKILAIIGDNGSGKSTILANLMGFYKPGSGKILINNINTQSIAIPDLRKQFSWVPQAINLFSGSLGENISFKSSGWDQGKIEKAIELADLESLVKNLPAGLQTYISEDGTNFSGGEKQKIAFARAVYRDAPVFLLDEPSASMDLNSEKKLLSSLDILKNENKSIIIVAHKLSVIYPADQILVLKEGKIIEKGDHGSLINSETVYKKLWSEQNISIT